MRWSLQVFPSAHDLFGMPLKEDAMKEKTNFDLVTAQIHNDEMTLREQFLMEYTTCCLCGSELLFTHVTHFVNNEVEEQTACESCGVKHVSKHYGLQ